MSGPACNGDETDEGFDSFCHAITDQQESLTSARADIKLDGAQALADHAPEDIAAIADDYLAGLQAEATATTPDGPVDAAAVADTLGTIERGRAAATQLTDVVRQECDLEDIAL